ncbi:DUF1146 family protein [Lacticaseibacillus nasuensis]|uniref:DUF1146 domain-containing protein n=1 Tax=Lacticaseibacillus nasuensis JCM 17158 TaxID=1291734 RepID=A0A0R1JXZ3_9LACO|nr:DUF1146 family protein [Lacticaseibacillus nasuensis]KRK74131.1 hypothetical protein FD02_GL000725 [Lacticaseibacillus nasuensis JCM 17158]
MTQGLGLSGAVTLISHFVFIMISFRLLTAVRFDKFLRPNHVRESQLLMVFIAIALGYLVSEFFLSLISSARALPLLLR